MPYTIKKNTTTPTKNSTPTNHQKQHNKKTKYNHHLCQKMIPCYYTGPPVISKDLQPAKAVFNTN